MPSQDLDKGIISIKSNYANARDVDNMRTFYNKVSLRLHSEYSNRLLSVNVFATGAIQIAGLKTPRIEIRQLKDKVCEIMNSCSGIVPLDEIVQHPVYGFYVHTDVIYGRPLTDPPGETNHQPHDTVLVPIGILRRAEGHDCVYLHGMEMKIVDNGSGSISFTPVHRRRHKITSAMRFDYLGRIMEDVPGREPCKSSKDDFTYHYSVCSSPVASSTWTHKISLMNAGFHLGGRLNLADLTISLRSLGFFVSFDPNIYRDINAKFMNGTVSTGTALITSTGYTRLYGFKSQQAITKAARDLRKVARSFILGQLP